MNEEEIKIEEPIEEIEDVSFESTEEGEGEAFAKDKLRNSKTNSKILRQKNRNTLPTGSVNEQTLSTTKKMNSLGEMKPVVI
jgi:hypothetical protein